MILLPKVPLHLDLNKVGIDLYAKLAVAHSDRDALAAMLRSGIASQSVACAALYDFGFKQEAVQFKPDIDLNPELLRSARNLCQTDAPLDMAVLLSSVPFRFNGEYYPRDQPLYRMNFSDGKAAYCKSRNILQEATGLALLRELGLPSYGYELTGDYIVLEGIPGRTLLDHALFSGKDSSHMAEQPAKSSSSILAVVAFDYIFGMMDRNERGVLSDGQQVFCVDHEYLFTYFPQSIQVQELINYARYAELFGLVLDPAQTAAAEKVFDFARSKKSAIAIILTDYVRTSPKVDLSFEKRTLDQGIVDKTTERIELGLAEFMRVLTEACGSIIQYMEAEYAKFLRSRDRCNNS